MKLSQDRNSASGSMAVDQDPEVSTRETLVYLEFGDKMKDYLFDNKIFFRMARFEETPLIQLNSHIFKGEYRSCLGTNIFFSDYTNEEPERIMESGNSIRLKHHATQFKIIDLKPVKIPSDMADLPQPVHDIRINKNYDYKSLLKKFAYGTLNLKDDLVVIPREKNTDQPYDNRTQVDGKEIKAGASKDEPTIRTVSKTEELLHSFGRSSVIPSPKMSNRAEKQLNACKKSVAPLKLPKKNEIVVNILTHKFEKLKRLARRPTRRRKEPEIVAECEEKYREAYAYNCLKCMIIKPSDYFRTISEKFNEITLEGAVDVDRSIMQGVLNYSPDYYRVLSEEEKTALMSIRNLENLSIAARYIVIKCHMDHLESTLPTLCREEFFEKDANGRTIRENIKIYKRLLRVLSGIVKEKYCYDSDVEDNS